MHVDDNMCMLCYSINNFSVLVIIDTSSIVPLAHFCYSGRGLYAHFARSL